MKNKVLISTLSIIVFVTLIFVPNIEADVPVKIDKARTEEINEMATVNGKTTPDKTISLVSSISAEVTKLNVKVGQYVEKGEKLVVFDDEQIRTQVKQAEAALERAKANHAKLISGASDEQIRASEAQVDQAKAGLAAAEANLDRLQKGADENDIKASLTGIKQAEASLKMAKAQHELLLEGASGEDIKRAEESYNQAVASHEGAKKALTLVQKIYNDKTSLKQQLTTAEMQLENSKKQLDSAQKRYEQSKVNLEQAQVNYEQAEKEYKRMKELYKDGVVTEKQFDMTESQYKNASLTVQNARSAVESAKIAMEQAEVNHRGAKETYKLTEETYNNPTQLKQQLDSARTQLEISRANKEIALANLEKIKKGARQGEIDRSLASIEQAEAALERAKANHAKLISGASDEQIRASEAQVDQAKAALAAAKANLDRLKKGADENDIKASLTGIKQAEASLEQAHIRLEDTVINSPMSGFIASVNTEEGQMVSPGTPLVNLVCINPLFVRVDVSSSILKNIETGDKVSVSILDYKDEVHTGFVEMISPVRDQQSQLYPIKVKLDNKDNHIKAGMFADVHFTLNTASNKTVVSVDAVLDIDENPYLYVIKDGKAVRKDVEVGLINTDKVEIVKGIKAGTDVVIQGQQSLQDGDSVEVIN